MFVIFLLIYFCVGFVSLLHFNQAYIEVLAAIFILFNWEGAGAYPLLCFGFVTLFYISLDLIKVLAGALALA